MRFSPSVPISVVPSRLGKSRTKLKLDGHQDNYELSLRLKKTLCLLDLMRGKCITDQKYKRFLLSILRVYSYLLSFVFVLIPSFHLNCV